MLIQCPRCSTGWRVADTPPTDNPIFKCGRCHHLFRRFPGAPDDGDRRSVSTKRRTRPPAGDNLEFIFPDEPEGDVVEAAGEPDAGAEEDLDDDEVTADTDTDAEIDEPGDEDEEEEEAGEDEDEDEPGDDEDEDEDEDEPGDEDEDEDEDDEEDEDEPGDDDDEDDEDDEDEDEDEDEDLVTATDDVEDGDEEDESGDRAPAVLDADLSYDDTVTSDEWAQELEAMEAPEPVQAARVLHVEDVMSRSYGFTTIARSLVAIVVLHALLALSIRLAPSYANAWLSRIPLAGALLAREPALTRRVELRNVAGAFQQLRNARRVFVVTGEAVNHSLASIERIEVEATLYDGNGRIDQKVVSAGNRTRLRDLSEKEIALLQRLDPRRILAPGESSTFLIVFLEPPRTVREFSSRVLNVRPTRRLATEPPTTPWRRRPVG